MAVVLVITLLSVGGAEVPLVTVAAVYLVSRAAEDADWGTGALSQRNSS